MVETQPAPSIFKERISYNFFVAREDPTTHQNVGYVPLDRAIFAPGKVVLHSGDKVLDVCARNGESTEYLIDEAPACHRKSIEWVASEPFEHDAQEMQTRFGNSVTVLKENAINAVSKVQDCDKIFFINGIHLLTRKEKESFINQSFHSLKSGGQLIITSTYIEEAVEASVKKDVLQPWMVTLFYLAKKDGIDTKAMLTRMRQVKEQTWSILDYQDQAIDAGFNIKVCELEEMPYTWKSYSAISHFGPFIKNIFPLEVSEEHASYLAFTALNKTRVRRGHNKDDLTPRNTMVLVAQKPQIAAEI